MNGKRSSAEGIRPIWHEAEPLGNAREARRQRNVAEQTLYG
jgi:hypothetical protein